MIPELDCLFNPSTHQKQIHGAGHSGSSYKMLRGIFVNLKQDLVEIALVHWALQKLACLCSSYMTINIDTLFLHDLVVAYLCWGLAFGVQGDMSLVSKTLTETI